jgi:hypothetical protein
MKPSTLVKAAVGYVLFVAAVNTVCELVERRRDLRIIAEAEAAYRADCTARVRKYHPSTGPWPTIGEES